MSDDLNKIYVRGYTPFKCYRDFVIIVILVALAASAPWISYLGTFKPSYEPNHIWFQRSGSVAVLLSLIAEYVISRLHGIIRPTGFTSKETEEIRKEIESPLMLLRYFGAAVAVIGTVIWGYGDLLV